MNNHYPEMYIYDGHKLTPLDGSSVMKFLTTGDDNVFILNGKDDEIYLIENKSIIQKLQNITEKYPEETAMSMILAMLNPKRYK
jgi:hypothetical protein